MIKAVLFDLDDTLLDREASVTYFVEQQYDRLRPVFNGVPKELYVRRFMALDGHGAAWKDAVYRQLAAEFNLTHISWQELLEDYRGRFEGYCLNLPGLETMLFTLAAQNRALGIITNGPSPFQEQKIKAMGIAGYFGVILVSDAIGIKKPNPEIFRRAINQLGVTAEETVFVGDNPHADILGAQAFGMKAVWKRVPFWGDCPSADAVCDDLARLPLIIQALEAQ